MRSAGVAFLIMLLALGGSAAAAPWLQVGHDAARTSATPDAGPATPDIAFHLQLPAGRGLFAGPIIVGDSVFTLVAPPSDGDGTGPGAIWRIDLDDATAAPLVEVGPATRVETAPLDQIASDGTLLFVAGGPGISAFRAQDGQPAWPSPYTPPALTTFPAYSERCGSMAHDEGVLYVACQQFGGDEGTGLDLVAGQLGAGRAPYELVTYVVALDAATGQERWLWSYTTTDEAGLSDSPVQAPWRLGFILPRVAVVGDMVLVRTHDTRPVMGDSATDPNALLPDSGYQFLVWALERASGAPRWKWGAPTPSPLPSDPSANPVTSPQEYTRVAELLLPPFPVFTGTTDEIYVGAHSLSALDPATGDVRWSLPLIQPGEPYSRGSPGIALAGGSIYITSASWLHRIDAQTRLPVWQAPLPSGDTYADTGGLTVAGGKVYSTTSDGFLVSFSTSDGTLLDHVALPAGSGTATPYTYGAGERVLVVASDGGAMVVIGRTSASVQMQTMPSTRFPAPGARVTLDLSATRPGALSAQTQYAADWGDGGSTPPQDAPVLEHTYAEPGTFTARIQARNAAGQTASETIVFEVGGAPSAAATYLDAPLSRENADLTFGFLGIALTAIGAVVAVTRHRRHQHAVVAVPGDRLDIYRSALEEAIGPDGRIHEREAAMLERLRGRLSVTDREHAVLEHAVRTGRDTPLALTLQRGQTVLGKYRIKERLGQGGQGEAYAAEDTVLHRDVVIKALRPGVGEEAAVLREAQTMSAIRHPNVVTVFDVERLGDQVFVVMEHMEGGSLADRLRGGALSHEELAALGRDLLSALDAVHTASAIHLDVKPANILLSRDGRAKLADFGIAHRPGFEGTAAAWRSTTSGGPGTVPYMSPEQAKGHRVTHRSDLYSAGLVVYEAATGRAYLEPVPGESAVELQMRAAAARPFDRHVEGPPAVRAWFTKALEPDAGKRFPSARDMLSSLEDALRPDAKGVPRR